MIEVGNRLLIAHRRLFEKDEPRYFIGEVVAYDGGLVKIEGYSFVRDVTQGGFIRKDDPRTKIMSIATGSFLVYQLPDETDVHSVRFESRNAELLLTDGKGLNMNMAEYPRFGQI